jgi:hypothetical protein
VNFCKVLGAVLPVDPNAPPVNFEVNLPMQWNGKALQIGGGGFNGTHQRPWSAYCYSWRASAVL